MRFMIEDCWLEREKGIYLIHKAIYDCDNYDPGPLEIDLMDVLYNELNETALFLEVDCGPGLY